MRKQPLHPRTALINTKQKNHAKIARQSALHWLAETFPEAFNNEVQIRPLKIGIMKDILLHADKAMDCGISKSKLREAVIIFTRRIDYLICLKAQEMRIDLEGNPTHAVTAEDVERAALKIKKRIEKGTKNLKKETTTKIPTRTTSTETSSHFKQQYPSLPVHPPMRAHTGGVAQPTTRPIAITIKNKSARQYDPSVVARLKEKLGLSSRKDEETSS
ncbi:MAG: ProQ/FinO family protein [Legionellaceae bacterium]